MKTNSLDERIEELAERITELYGRIKEVPIVGKDICSELLKKYPNFEIKGRKYFITEEPDINRLLLDVAELKYSKKYSRLHLLYMLKSHPEKLKEELERIASEESTKRLQAALLEGYFSLLEGDVRNLALKTGENPLIQLLGESEESIIVIPRKGGYVVTPVKYNSGVAIFY